MSEIPFTGLSAPALAPILLRVSRDPDLIWVPAVAAEFAKRFAAEFSPASLQAVDFRNISEGYTSSVCHSHDYGDANVLMKEAMHKVFGDLIDLESDRYREVWDLAWKMTKAAGFMYFAAETDDARREAFMAEVKKRTGCTFTDLGHSPEDWERWMEGNTPEDAVTELIEKYALVDLTSPWGP